MTAEAAGTIPRLAQGIAAAGGWRRVVLAPTLGLAAAAAMPPFNLVPLLAVAFTGLAWLLDGAASRRRAALDGWLWGMGFFVPSLYWVAISMFVDIGQFWWMVPLAVLGLPAYLAIYGAAAAAVVQATTPARSGRRLLALAAWFVVGEWLRGHLLTGFPWLLVGYAWSGDAPGLLAMAQSTALFGIYGLSLLTAGLAVAPARLAHPVGPEARWIPVLTVFAIGCAFWTWGLARLGQGSDPDQPGIRVRIVSTDEPHRATWNAAATAADFRALLAEGREPGLDKVRIAVWPEGIVDYYLNVDQGARAAVATAVPPDGVVLTGTLRAERNGEDPRVWNSILAEDVAGAIVGGYDKHHLVPFGEYVPLHRLLAFSQIASARFDFSTGPGPRTVHLPGLPSVAPVICYEAIFPGEITDPADPPGWILNVTDDGWFGRSIGPAQHFAIARIRAIEEGLPLVRAANGGISGLVDPHGRRVATLPLGETGPLDVALPAPLGDRTLYGQYGSRSLVFLIILPILGSILPREYFWRRGRA
jgi:apolipoprotein N-acyltransferase